MKLGRVCYQRCLVYILLVMMVSEMVLPSVACPSDSTDCSKCILDRMKFNCPACVSIMRCMARCLWGGTSRTKCIKKCDCNTEYPRLSDCKKCLLPCKCKCSA